MDTERFDHWTRSLHTVGSSRRAVSQTFAGGVFGALLASFGWAETEAKCVNPGKRCKKKKGKKKKCCGGAKCKGKKCKCPAGRQACGKTCCDTTALCQGQTCLPCDVCDSGCAFASVQAAMANAAAGATLLLCPGTYTGSLNIQQDLTLIGAGAGRTTLAGPGTSRVAYISSLATVLIQDLTVTDGHEASSNGGGVWNDGELTLDGVSVTGNTAASIGGGGIFSQGTLVLNSSSVTANISGTRGGGIYAHVTAGTVTVQNGSTVTGNTAVDTGGGIYAADEVFVAPGSVTGNTPNNCAPPGAVDNCVG